MQKARAEICKLETVTRSLMSCIECPICMETMTEAASGCCGHCFCIGCFGCSLTSSFSCPTCREPVKGLVRQFAVEQIAARLPLLKDIALQLGVNLAQRELDFDARRRLAEVEAELQKERCRFKELEHRCEEQKVQIHEQAKQIHDTQQKMNEIQQHLESEVQQAHRQTQQLREEMAFLRQSSQGAEETLQMAKQLEHAVVNVMEHTNSMIRVVIGSGWQELCLQPPGEKVQQVLGLFHNQGFAEFGVVRDCLQDTGQECMGNMSLGISPDLRFKLEYYGSTQHVFNELELEGTVQVDGGQLTFLVTRSSSSQHDGEDSEVQKMTLPPLHGLLCCHGENAWIVLLDFSASAQISIFNSTDIILLKDPQKLFTGYQTLTW